MNSFLACFSSQDHVSRKANFFKLNVQVIDNSICLLCIYDLYDLYFLYETNYCKYPFFNYS